MLRVLIDTSVWLDLAVRRDGQIWIVPLRGLIAQGKLELLVPVVVVDEFERNRPRLEAALTTGVIDRLNQLRKDLREFAGDKYEGPLLEEIRQLIPLVNAMTPQNFQEIVAFLGDGRTITPTEVEYANVVRRGLDKTAPFHSIKGSKNQPGSDKNCVAHALLIEMYASEVKRADPADRYCFVTSNHRDFSMPNGDHRQPHPDLAELFDGTQSRYIYQLEGLDALLSEDFSDEFQEFLEEREETEFIINAEEPRTLAEIVDALAEFFDRVWYVRSIVGSSERDDAELPDDIREGMLAARAAIEEKYGRKELRKPIGRSHDKAWEYGYINGKLAALRWVLGSEWDFLDT